MQREINYGFIAGQINHWLSCPANGYLGSNYGIDLKQYLHKPMTQFEADKIIEKMRADIPVLQAFPSGAVNILSVDDGVDGKQIYIQVNDKIIRAA